MERLKHRSLEINPFESIGRTARLIHEFPQFQEKVQSAISLIPVEGLQTRRVIREHYGVKYEEMGFCAKAFADMVEPTGDNTDIGICGTEFYIFIDIVDDLVDEQASSSSQKVTYLDHARDILNGKMIDQGNPDLEAMTCITSDLTKRVAQLSKSPDDIQNFIHRCLGTINACMEKREDNPRLENW